MRFYFSLLAAFCMGLTDPALAQSPLAGSNLPPELRTLYISEANECRDMGGRFVADPDGFVTKVELNGDGKPDWIVHRAGLYCTSGGFSAWCGTAGCSVEIHLSQGNRLRSVWEANVRGIVMTDLPDGRKGLLVSGHGTACSASGAEVCVSTIVWNGKNFVTFGKVRRATESDLRLLDAAEGAAPPAFDSRWRVADTPDYGPVALLAGHPQIPTMLVRCFESAPTMQLKLGKSQAGFTLPLPVAGKPLVLHLGGNDEEVPEFDRSIYLFASGADREFGAKLTPGHVSLLGGKAEWLDLQISVNDGSTWFPAQGLPLGGSTVALSTVSKACSSGVANGRSKSPAVRNDRAVPPLGIVPGYYVTESESCQKPANVFYYDGKQVGLMGGSAEETFVEPIGPVSRDGKEWFLSNWEMLVNVLAPTRIQRTVQDIGSPERWCPAESIPARFKVKS